MALTFLSVFAAANMALAQQNASITTVEFEAQVVLVADPSGCLCARINRGFMIRGTYTYDPTVADSNPDITTGEYWFQDPSLGITLNIGDGKNETTTGTDPKSTNFVIGLMDGPGSDHFILRSDQNVALPCGTAVDRISLQLDDDTGAALTDTTLISPDLTAFQSARLTLLSSNTACSYLIRADVTSVERVN